MDIGLSLRELAALQLRSHRCYRQIPQKKAYTDDESLLLYCAECYTTKVTDPFNLLYKIERIHLLAKNEVSITTRCMICKRLIINQHSTDDCATCATAYFRVGGTGLINDILDITKLQ